MCSHSILHIRWLHSNCRTGRKGKEEEENIFFFFFFSSRAILYLFFVRDYTSERGRPGDEASAIAKFFMEIILVLVGTTRISKSTMKPGVNNFIQLCTKSLRGMSISYRESCLAL